MVDLFNVDAERWLVGATLKDCAAVLPHAEDLHAEDFSWEPHQHIWRAIRRLQADRVPVDIVTVANRLQQEQLLEVVGGPKLLDEWVEGVKITIGAPARVGIVKKWARLRKHLEVLTSEAHKVATEDAATDPDAFLAGSMQRIADAVGRRSSSGGLRPMAEVCTDAWNRLNERLESPWRAGLPLELPGVSECLAIHPGDVLCIGAPPATGKTAALLQVLKGVSRSGLGRAALFSLEMPDDQLVWRLAAESAGVSTHQIRKGMVSRAQLGRIHQVLGELSQLNILVDSTPGLTIEQVTVRVRQAAFRHGRIACVGIDYLQLMGKSRALGRETNRSRVVGHNAQGCKELAKSEDCAVIFAAQLSRDARKSGREPDLHDLRDSGEIEQAIDGALMLHRPAQEDDGGPVSESWPLVQLLRKNRNGPCGRWESTMHGPTMSIRGAAL